MDEQNRNLILATALSGLVILVWLTFFPPQEPASDPAAGQSTATQTTPGTGDTVASTPSATGDEAASAPTLPVTPEENLEAALARTDRIRIETPRLTGSISLRGGRIDDLSLSDYHETLDKSSPTVRLLSPVGGPEAYYALYGWAPVGDLDFADVPDANTPWTVESGATLDVGKPVTLVWNNGKGLIFRRTISVDENYMFSIAQSVENTSGAEVKLQPYGIIARHGTPKVIGFYILHEGVVRAEDGTIEEIKYKNMPDAPFNEAEGANVEAIDVQSDGWIGFTDKYWMTTLIAPPGQGFKSVAKYTARTDTYQTDMRLPIVSVAAGQTQSVTTSLFAGAKEWETIRHYQNDLGIKQFIDSIDWGWFFFLTKPIFWVLHTMHGLIGNMGWSIIGLTVLIKALLFPLAYKSFVSMAKMKTLQPEMEKIKERCGDDRQKLQQETMKLYRDKKVNPAAGCLPILVQIPIFFSLYKVIFVTIELRQAPFIFWIKDLAAPDPTSILNLFGLLPYATPDPTSFLHILSLGVLPILLGISMWMQQKLNPAPTDPTQAMIFAWMPWVFMFMLGRFASGLVVYWIANNTITFIQQYTIMRSQGVKPDVFGNIRRSFARSKPKAAGADKK
jgi:YidC/Oxa1 family membrane protein insertase